MSAVLNVEAGRSSPSIIESAIARLFETTGFTWPFFQTISIVRLVDRRPVDQHFFNLERD
jgi:hypothetical protein